MTTQPTQFELWNEQAGPHWAEEWERYDAMLRPFGQLVLDAVDARPGERVVDVGCGNGWLSLEIAGRVAPGGEVLGVDISAPMLARARERAAELTNVRFEQADAATYGFDGGFDAVVSRFGVMFFEEPPAAFVNLARALKPGGRVAFICWQDMMQNTWMAVPGMAAMQHVSMPSMDPDAPGPFAFASEDKVRGTLEGAGLTDVRLDDVRIDMRTGTDADDTVAHLRRSDIGRRLLANAEPDAVERAFDAVREALRDFEGPDGVMMPSAAWVVTAGRA